MRRDGIGTKSQRDDLRRQLLEYGYNWERIATEMAVRWGFRPRTAWRHAYGWTQDEVAARYNQVINSDQASMTGKRISDFENWPAGGVRPTLRTLMILAEVYQTTPAALVDLADRKKLSRREQFGLESKPIPLTSTANGDYTNPEAHSVPTAGQAGLSQPQVSSIERGHPFTEAKLTGQADALNVPGHLQWSTTPGRAGDRSSREVEWQSNTTSRLSYAPPWAVGERDDMNRRDLLWLLTMVGTAAALPSTDVLDVERLQESGRSSGRAGAATLDAFAALNTHLWGAFRLSASKRAVLPLVRQQLDVLTAHLQRSQSIAARTRMYALIGDLFQIAGEIWFDSNRYLEAAHCYTLAATASREANHADLWACALVRHAFIGIYERQYVQSTSMLELADRLAHQGDGTLSTRHWVAVVQAESFAGLGKLGQCQQALDIAETVHLLTGDINTGGWLRFDGSRLDEERGTCYTTLQRPDLAEAALQAALPKGVSSRRRGSVYVDLATVGLQLRDPQQVITYASAALEMAVYTDSGYVVRKLEGLRKQLTPLLDNADIRSLNQQVTELVATRNEPEG